MTVESPTVATGSPEPSEYRTLSAAQRWMLTGVEGAGAAFHLIYSADIRGVLDAKRLRIAINHLTRRHESLRTSFSCVDDDVRRRVLPAWSPQLIDLGAIPAGIGDPVSWVHSVLEPSSSQFLRPFERPPVVFFLARASRSRHVLSMLIHHAITDAWSIGLFWRELAECYATARLGGTCQAGQAPSIESAVAAENSLAMRRAVAKRAQELSDVPADVEIPSDLPRPEQRGSAGARIRFPLSSAASQACAELSGSYRVSRDAVLSAAWGLVIARRSARNQLILGVDCAGRPDTAAIKIFGLCAKLLPVLCVVQDDAPIRDYLLDWDARLRAAMAAQVQLEPLVRELGGTDDLSRPPLVQVGFAAQDGLIPERLQTDDLVLEVREGYCGGTVLDACLNVRWRQGRGQLVLDYNPAVILPDEACRVLAATSYALTEMAHDPGRLLSQVRTISPAQRLRLAELGSGAHTDVDMGLWQLVEGVGHRFPDRVAVRGAGPRGTLTYRQLLEVAATLSGVLAGEGARAGDRVALMCSRSAEEIAAILAILRLGAAYVGIDPSAPPAVAEATLKIAAPRLILADHARMGELPEAARGYRLLEIKRPGADGGAPTAIPRAAPPDPARIAYVAFTSGSTGTPKGIQVPQRGVIRLVHHENGYLRPAALARFMRLAPLAFDASTLEIFAPLAAGGTIEIYPAQEVDPAGLASFVKDRDVTGMWLTAGLFRLVADYRPDAFAGVHQLLTGGDVVPPAQVLRVLRQHPGLRVTNGYGPTENTTFTAVHQLDDPADVEDPLPIGRPVPGTGVVLLDRNARLVPLGGIGELYAYGDGLAEGYLGRPAQAEASFGRLSPDVNSRLYRTGDLARWDSAGRLRFLGRHDDQVKIRGFRIELGSVASAVRQHPEVRDVVVIPVTVDGEERRLLAGVLARPRPGLVPDLRRHAREHLPAYAVPALWVVTDSFPVTKNGKVDHAELRRMALDKRFRQRPALPPGEGAG